MKEQEKSITNFSATLQTGFWGVIIVLTALVSFNNFSWPGNIIRLFLLLACHFINFYGFYFWFAPRYFEKSRYLIAVFGGLVFLLALLPARVYLETLFQPIAGSVLDISYRKKITILFILFSEITIASFATLLRQAVGNEEKKDSINALAKLHLQTELNFLKGQMSPHFLFNSINNIYSLTLIKSSKAPDALLKLSGLLRYLLYENNKPVPLQRELAAILDYKSLFELKNEKELNFRLQFDVPDKALYIEPLMILPLLENAVKHSMIGSVDNAFIDGSVTYEAQHIHIHIRNSKPVQQLQQEFGGIGLSNIRKRLQLVYAHNYKMEIQNDPAIFYIHVQIPAGL